MNEIFIQFDETKHKDTMTIRPSMKSGRTGTGTVDWSCFQPQMTVGKISRQGISRQSRLHSIINIVSNLFGELNF